MLAASPSFPPPTLWGVGGGGGGSIQRRRGGKEGESFFKAACLRKAQPTEEGKEEKVPGEGGERESKRKKRGRWYQKLR